MIINLTFDQSSSSLPSGFVAAVEAVAQFYENTFTNPITINIDVGYGEIGPNNSSLGSNVLGESETYFNNYTYSQIRNALVTGATSADQVSAANSLPVNDPTNGGNYWVSTAEAKAMGLAGPSSAIDGYVGFSNTNAFTYNTVNGGSVAPGKYDFFGVVAHEFSEVMGRGLFVGNDGIGSNSYTPLDLFHYSSNGTRDFSGTQVGYFSLNGGATNLDNFNTNPNGDFGDWASSAGNDSFLAFSNSGVGNAVTQTDLRELNVLGYGETPVVAAPGSSAVIGDFAGGSKSGIVWESASNTPTMWLMNGSTVGSSATLPTPPSSWKLIASGDFNGNGMSDLLWQNTDGTPAIWMMNGSSIVSAGLLPNPTTAWHAVATGDFNGNGNADILWQNTNGAPSIWMMNGTSIVSTAMLPNPGSAWHVVATGDFNGNGRDDILWQNSDGTPAIWLMNGTAIIGAAVLPNPTAAWHIVGTGDLNGNGDSDILWQNSDGTPAVWLMNGTGIVGAATLSNLGSGWKLLGAGNFYGAGDNDLLFVNTSTEQVQIWVMNGTQVSSIESPQNSGAALGSSYAIPLSSNPVLSAADISYTGTSGAPGSFGAPLLGSGSSQQRGFAPLGVAPTVGLVANDQLTFASGTGSLNGLFARTI